MKLKVFADLHHYDLYYSLQLLFEKRLNCELYRGIGMEWYEQGYWGVFPHPDTARQYLGIDHGNKRPKDIHGNELPDSACVNLRYHIEDGIYYCTDSTKDGVFQRGITLDKFKDTEFDILISSMPVHIGPFNKLIREFQPKAKHIFQVGNAWGHLPGVQNILASTAPFSVPSGVNICFYHQEFNTDQFCWEKPTNRDTIRSYVHYMQRPDLVNQLRANLPDYTIETCGAGMDRNIALTSDEAEAVKDSTFTYHYKPEGDGYGYSLFRSYACGRPALVWAPFYRGKLGEQLMVDRETCIDISTQSMVENIRLIRHYSQPEEHNRMCENARKKFEEVVNFGEEEQQIRKFLENLR